MKFTNHVRISNIFQRLRKLTQPSPLWYRRRDREMGAAETNGKMSPSDAPAYSNPAFEKSEADLENGSPPSAGQEDSLTRL